MANSGFSVAGVAEKVVGGVVTAVIVALAGAAGMGWLRVNEWWWAAPVMYALVTGGLIFGISYGLLFQVRARLYWWVFSVLLVCMFFVLLYVDTRSQRQVVIAPPSPLAPPTKPVPTRLTEIESMKLTLEFLKLPRPCVLRVLGHSDNLGFRDDLVHVVGAGVRSLIQNQDHMVFSPDQCYPPKGADNDDHPQDYEKQPEYARKETVIVSAAASSSWDKQTVDQTVEHIVSKLRETLCPQKPDCTAVVRGDTTLPNGSGGLELPDDDFLKDPLYLYIKIGEGSLRKQ